VSDDDIRALAFLLADKHVDVVMPQIREALAPHYLARPDETTLSAVQRLAKDDSRAALASITNALELADYPSSKCDPTAAVNDLRRKAAALYAVRQVVTARGFASPARSTAQDVAEMVNLIDDLRREVNTHENEWAGVHDALKTAGFYVATRSEVEDIEAMAAEIGRLKLQLEMPRISASADGVYRTAFLEASKALEEAGIPNEPLAAGIRKLVSEADHLRQRMREVHKALRASGHFDECRDEAADITAMTEALIAAENARDTATEKIARLEADLKVEREAVTRFVAALHAGGLYGYGSTIADDIERAAKLINDLRAEQIRRFLELRQVLTDVEAPKTERSNDWEVLLRRVTALASERDNARSHAKALEADITSVRKAAEQALQFVKDLGPEAFTRVGPHVKTYIEREIAPNRKYERDE
jgi:DNA repair exonuclease SbcCD ATPase subunit